MQLGSPMAETAEQLRVLIADSDQGTLHILARYFERAGYGAYCAQSSDEALELISQERPTTPSR